MKKYFLLPLIMCSAFICADDGTIKESVKDGSTMIVCSYSAIKKNETLPLSHFINDCKLIHFEDIDEALFKVWFTTVTDKYIGVRQQSGGAYKLFDSSGKFLCDIGSVGQGPGEYSIAIYDDLIDDKNEKVYITTLNADKILVYDTSGKFIKNINAPHRLNKPKMYLSDDGILTVVHMAFPGNKAIVIQFDSEGNVIKQLAPIPHLMAQNYDGEIFNTRNTSAFEFLYTGSDTLYHYNIKANKIEPVFTVAVKSSEKPFRQYIELNNMYITNIWSENKTILTDMKTKNSSYIKVRNDFWGNIEVRFSVVTLRNGRYVLNLEPGELIDLIEKRVKESDCSAQDRQKLKTLQDSLDKNANNVLLVGKIK